MQALLKRHTRCRITDGSEMSQLTYASVLCGVPGHSLDDFAG